MKRYFILIKRKERKKTEKMAEGKNRREKDIEK